MTSHNSIVVTLYPHDESPPIVLAESGVIGYSSQGAIGNTQTFVLRLLEDQVKDLTGGEIVFVTILTATVKGRDVYTSSIGYIETIARTTHLLKGGYVNTITYTCQSFVGLMKSDIADYRMLYGSALSVLGSDAKFPGEMKGARRLDRSFNIFLKFTAGEVMRINRLGKGILQLMGYKIKSVEGRGVVNYHLVNYEGSLWSAFQSYGEMPLHEIFDITVPETQWEKREGFTNEVTLSAFGEDEAVNGLVFRPAPFPFSEDGATVDFSLWGQLTLHDFTTQDLITAVNLQQGGQANINFVAIHTKVIEPSGVMKYFETPPIYNEDKHRLWGFKPLSWTTFLVGTDDNDRRDITEFLRALNWRLATQNNRLDEALAGNITLAKIQPHIQVGERLRFNYPLGSTNVYEFYIEGVQHTFDTAQRSTTLTVSRGFAQEVYTPSGASFLLEGLASLPPANVDHRPVGGFTGEEEFGPVVE